MESDHCFVNLIADQNPLNISPTRAYAEDRSRATSPSDVLALVNSMEASLTKLLVSPLLSKATSLRALSIRHCHLKDNRVAELLHALLPVASSTLTQLDVSGNNLGPHSAKELARMLELGWLRHTMELRALSSTASSSYRSSHGIGRTSLSSTSSRGKLCVLERLEIQSAELADKDGAVIAGALGRNQSLNVLDLERNRCAKLTAEAMLKALERNRSLTSVNLKLCMFNVQEAMR